MYPRGFTCILMDLHVSSWIHMYPHGFIMRCQHPDAPGSRPARELRPRRRHCAVAGGSGVLSDLLKSFLYKLMFREALGFRAQTPRLK